MPFLFPHFHNLQALELMLSRFSNREQVVRIRSITGLYLNLKIGFILTFQILTLSSVYLTWNQAMPSNSRDQLLYQLDFLCLQSVARASEAETMICEANVLLFIRKRPKVQIEPSLGTPSGDTALRSQTQGNHRGVYSGLFTLHLQCDCTKNVT